MLRVQPKASRNKLSAGSGDKAGWKLTLTAPPVEGKANRACLEFLAKVLGVPRSSLRIVRGETARQKTIEVQGLSGGEVEERLIGAAGQ